MGTQYPLFRLSKRRKVPLVVAIRVILYRRGKILLIKRAMGRDKGKWELPGGKVEDGQFSHDALKREVKEETGLTISPRSTEFFTFVSNQCSSEQYLELVLECSKFFGKKPRLSPEHAEFRWITIEESLSASSSLILTDRAREVLELVLR